MAKLLIVDDEEKIREVLRLYAEFEGHECVKRNLREGALAVRTNGGGSVISLNDTVGHLSSPLVGASESI